MEKMFEMAVRNKMRFPFRGYISVEDLWDLSVQDLDGIFKTLNSSVKRAQEESLLEVKSAEDEKLLIKIEIVKYIVRVKLAEADAAIQSKERSEKKQKLMELIAAKQDQELGAKSVDELKAMLDELK